MIAKAKSIPHGHADLSYITGESPNKKHPEKIIHLCNNLLSPHLTAQGVWESFKMELAFKQKHIKNDVIRMEISPAMEHTKHFTLDDWRKLLFDVLAAYDKQQMRGKNGKVYSERTNLTNSMFTAWLHFESDSGIPHIHVAVLRIDKEGLTNNDHRIDRRARRAAEMVALDRGWTTATEIRRANLDKLEADCKSILRSMPAFSYDAYFGALRLLDDGYDVNPKYDNNGILRNYTIYDGYKKYRASDIGRGRHFTVSQLKRTWDKLHAESLQNANKPAADLQQRTNGSARPLQQQCNGSATSVQRPCTSSAEPMHQPQQAQQGNPSARDYTVWQPNTTPYDYECDGTTTRYYLPTEVMEYLDDEFDYRTTLNWDDLTRAAVGAFVGIVLGPSQYVSVGTGGGSSNNDLPKRDEDDDDLLWARRCARYASKRIGKKPKSKMKR